MDGIIDIAECRKALDMDKTATVMLNDKQGFVVRMDVKKQERLIRRYVNPQIQFDDKTFNKVMRLQAEKGSALDESEVEQVNGMVSLGGNEDFYGLGLALIDFFDDWIGFKGRYNKQDALWFLENFPDLTKAMGRSFRQILTKYQEAHLIYEDALEKN